MSSMNDVVFYILKSSICLTLFYAVYKLCLSSETFYRINRIVLLCMYALALSIPLLKMPIDYPIDVHRYVAGVEHVFVVEDEGKTGVVTGMLGWKMLCLIYILGVSFFIFRDLYSIVCLWLLLQKGLWSRWNDGSKLIVLRQVVAPFSWMGCIVISERDLEENGEIILIHEAAHAKYHHSIDLFFSELFLAVHWFNPIAWLMKKELQRVHEYQADEAVLSRGVNAKMYQLLLIKRTIGERHFNALTCGFDHGKLKNRIMMMLKKKSNPLSVLKCLYMVPVIVISMFLLGCAQETDREIRNGEVFLPIVMGGKEFAVKKSIIIDLDGRRVPVILELGRK